MQLRDDGSIGVADAHSGSDPRVLLAGELSAVGFPDLVSVVVQSRLSGSLRVATPRAVRTLVFAEGEVRGVSSNRVGERLGEVAVGLGLLKAEDADELFSEPMAGKRRCRIAVERGLLTERQLWAALQEHVTAIFEALIPADRGHFVLLEGTDEEALTVPGLPAEAILLEALRRVDESRQAPGAWERLAGPFQAYEESFRQIFGAAREAGALEPLREAAGSFLLGEPSLPETFRDLSFGRDGSLTEEGFRKAVEALPEPPEEAARSAAEFLSKALLFVLFVAGEHLEAEVHRRIHDETKARVAAAR